MFSLSIVDTIDKTYGYRNICTIEPSYYALNEVKLQLNLDAPHQMDITINAGLPFWNDFIKNQNWGVRYKTDIQDIVFIRQDHEIHLYGVANLKLLSSVYNLEFTQRNIKDQNYKGDLEVFLNQITTDYIFTPISSSRNININTGVNSNLWCLNEAIQHPQNFSWRENGLKDSGNGFLKTEILFGNFANDISSYYLTSNNKRCKFLTTTTFTSSDNLDPDVAIIKDVTRHRKGSDYTHLLAVGDQGQGTALNSSIRLDNPDAYYINKEFPLVYFTNPYTRKNDYYIYNPRSLSNTFKFKEYVHVYASNEENTNTVQDLSEEAKEEILYNKTCNYIKSLAIEEYNVLDIDLKYAILPGNEIIIDFIQKVNGVNVLEIKETQIVKNYEFDLSQLQN